ncbi:MAG: NAD(P)-binding domain-containing protein [Patescibacteria group bacterium]
MKNALLKILLYGGNDQGNTGQGHVSSALTYGWEVKKIVTNNQVAKIGRPKDSVYSYGDITPQNADVIIIAVKPGDVSVVASDLRGKLRQDQLIISTAALLSLGELQKLFSHEAVVRTMPTLGLSVAMSDTMWLADPGLNQEHIELVEYLFGNLGKLTRAEHDFEVDTHTLNAACLLGEIAWLLCKLLGSDKSGSIITRESVLYNTKTVIALVEQLPGLTLETLAKDVQTPNGITEKIITSLEANNLSGILQTGIEAGLQRLVELLKQFNQPHEHLSIIQEVNS